MNIEEYEELIAGQKDDLKNDLKVQETNTEKGLWIAAAHKLALLYNQYAQLPYSLKYSVLEVTNYIRNLSIPIKWDLKTPFLAPEELDLEIINTNTKERIVFFNIKKYYDDYLMFNANGSPKI